MVISAQTTAKLFTIGQTRFLAASRMVLQKRTVRQFILFSWISTADAGVEDIKRDVTRATPVWIPSPEDQFSFNKNGRKYFI